LILGIIFGLFFFGIGVAIFVAMFVYRYQHAKRLFEWEHVTAERVIDANILQFTYVDGYGEEHLWHPTSGDNVCMAAHAAELLLHPDDPAKAVSEQAVPRWQYILGSIVFCFSGLVVFYFGFLVPHFGIDNSDTHFALILGVVFVCVGATFIASTIYRLFWQWRKKKTFEQCDATVVDHIADLLVSASANTGQARAATVLMPVFEYSAFGATFRMSGFSARHKFYSNLGIPPLGETRKIWINPNNPHDAFIKEPFVHTAAMLLVFGLASLIMGLLLVLLVPNL
jgi:hypothetical protein